MKHELFLTCFLGPRTCGSKNDNDELVIGKPIAKKAKLAKYKPTGILGISLHQVKCEAFSQNDGPPVVEFDKLKIVS